MFQNCYGDSILAMGKPVVQRSGQLYEPKCQLSADDHADGRGVRLRDDCRDGYSLNFQIYCPKESEESHLSRKY